MALGVGVVLLLARVRRVVGAEDVDDAVGERRPDRLRDARSSRTGGFICA